MQLSTYALCESDTRGRRYLEASHPYRSCYQRDRDRIIHSKAFRRLENKTQVFDPQYSDHFRNRLTHTLEVTQISRTISQQLQLNTDLCEVLALSHDIGHPPFSHEGEKVLNEIMTEYGSAFDHNLHALRVVEDFEEKYAGFRGLNLTFEVREGIVKHSRDYGPDENTYIDISEYLPGQRPPLEAQTIDLGDEIAYNAADLDDGYSSALLSVEQISERVPLFRKMFGQVQNLFPEAEEKLHFYETVRSTINLLVTNLIESTQLRLREEGITTVEDVRCYPHRLVGFDQETAQENAQLKSFLREKLYDHPSLKEARHRARHQIRDLFEFYFHHPEKLPRRHEDLLDDLPLHRVVCDYIAGMTDSFARLRHLEYC